ncbi:hypothetical protein [Brevibacillus sp. FIR094]|uniref:hypothetical protein n=1 Tax=Brevibacillus sp. FIR094 TaxID=3134809 RepID=UPI003D1E126A
MTPLRSIGSVELAGLYVIIYDSVLKDFAIAVSWYEECIRREWGVVKNMDRDERKIKLTRDDGCWWVPIDNLLQVERV